MVVIDANILYTVVFVIVVAGRIINAQGGLKIVLWRIQGKRWFLHTRREPDTHVTRKARLWKTINTTVTPHRYTVDGKDWFVGGPRETARLYGGSQWVYNFNDSRPLPLEQVEMAMVEIEETVKQSDGTEKTVKARKPVVIAGKPIDPMLIHAGFENKSIEAFNRLSDKPQRFRWGLFGFAMILILVMVAFNVLYTYYYGVNIACAVHAKGVQCG